MLLRIDDIVSGIKKQ